MRGRDSAGLHLFVWHHGLDLADPAVAAAARQRTADPLFQSGSVRVAGDCLSFVYKAAAEIGELGDNARALRAAVAEPTACCGWRSPQPDATVVGARPHPVGQRRHHQRAQLPPGEQRARPS